MTILGQKVGMGRGVRRQRDGVRDGLPQPLGADASDVRARRGDRRDPPSTGTQSSAQQRRTGSGHLVVGRWCINADLDPRATVRKAARRSVDDFATTNQSRWLRQPVSCLRTSFDRSLGYAPIYWLGGANIGSLHRQHDGMAIWSRQNAHAHAVGLAQDRRGQHLCRTAQSDELAIPHQCNPVGEARRSVQVVQHGNRRQPAPGGGAAQQHEHLKLMGDVQSARWFVQEQHLRVGCEHLGQKYKLPLSAAQFPNPARCEVGDA